MLQRFPSKALALMRPTIALALALAAVSLGSGCNDSQIVTELTKVARASGTQAYRGVRIVELFTGKSSESHREQVLDLGGDDVGARLLDVGGAPASDVQQVLFAKDARLLLRYRDLALDDVDRVIRNYVVERIAGSEKIADRGTFQIRFHHKKTAGLTVDLFADVETGLILQLIRTAPTGEMLYRMRFERVEIGGVARDANDPPRAPEPPRRVRDTEPAPFQPLEASVVPAGFERSDHFFGEVLVGAKAVRAHVDRFSDGLQHLFVVQGGPGDELWVLPPSSAPAGQPTFYTATLGAISIVWGRAEDRTLAGYGPFSDTALAALIAGYSFSR